MSFINNLMRKSNPNYSDCSQQELNEQNENLLEENGYLEYKLEKLDRLLFEKTQENAILSDRVEELEGDLESSRVNKGEERDIESYVYMETMLANSLDKTTKERNTYKETINIMCDKFEIKHEEVYKIIDSIQESKIEREK